MKLFKRESAGRRAEKTRKKEANALAGQIAQETHDYFAENSGRFYFDLEPDIGNLINELQGNINRCLPEKDKCSYNDVLGVLGSNKLEIIRYLSQMAAQSILEKSGQETQDGS